MLASSVTRIVESLDDDAVVLDIGGWGKPFRRADWVVDLMPYETRGYYGFDGPGEERFTADTWIQRDICGREPFPFDDNSFDFVICSHVLEDIRDPIFVCSEIVRVGKAGYVEVPSRLEEQSAGFQGPWVGWGHHHWLVDIDDENKRVEFVFKHHILHGRDTDHFPPGFQQQLTEEQRVQSLWWEGSFDFEERVFIGPGEIDAYLADFVNEHRNDVVLPEKKPTGSPAKRPAWRRAAGKAKRTLSRS